LKNPDIRWNPEIEYIRGVAILLIISIHTTAYFILIDVHNFLFYFNAAVDVFSHIGVPIFIFVSGFVLAINYRNHFSLKLFFKKRIPRILIPYVTFSIFYLLIYELLLNSNLIQNQKELSQLSYNEILFRLISGTAHYHLWFLILILELYTLYPIIIKIHDFFSKLNKQYLLLFIVFATQVIMSIVNYYYPKTDLFYLVFLNYIFYFVIGIFLSENYQKFKQLIRNIKESNLFILFLLSLGLTSILTLFFVQNYMVFFKIQNPFFGYYILLYPLYLILNLILLFSIICALERSKICYLQEFLKTLSKYSFGIYLIHPFFIEAVFFLIMPILDLNVNNWLFYPILFIFALFLSLISIKILDNIPYTSIFLGVK